MMDTLDGRLLRLLADGHFHSGTALAESLGISRAAVWKHVRNLESLGLELAAVPGRGYRLVSPVERLEAERIRAALSAEAAALLDSLELHECLDSTNSHLMRGLAAGKPSGTVCLAESQRVGRGRVGRGWVSPYGANIYLSLLWRLDDPARIAGLSLAVGVAVLRALRWQGIQGLGLKWPNDILWRDAKLGGILLEVAGEAHGHGGVVVGLGLNRHLPSSAASAIDQDWTDLDRITAGKPPGRNALAARLLNELLPLLRDYPVRGLAPYLPEWRAAHAFAGREGTIQLGDVRVRGRILDVTNQGLLLFEEQGGRLRQFASGEIQLRAGNPA